MPRDADERQVERPDTRGFDDTNDTSTSPTCPRVSGSEPETTIKTKLLSAWNNVKYGKNAWATSDMFKPGFSRNSPVWLLGHAYHRKLVSATAESPTGNTVRTFSETDCGIEEFQRDFQSRIWMTYRRDFPEIGSSRLTTDCGWGCMIRSGQMMIAQALICHWLGRDWRLTSSKGIDLNPTERWQSERLYRAVIQLFSDIPDTRAAPLSLHSVVGLGQAAGKKAGDWFGPHTVAHLLAGAARRAERGAGQGLLDTVSVYVAQDCTVYTGDVENLCSSACADESLKNFENCDESSDFSLVDLPGTNSDISRDVEIDGETWCLEHQESPAPVVDNSTSSWRSVIILIPVRLGSEIFNPIYNSCIKNLLTLECCIGIIGGKPKHSLYFIGFQDDDLIHLDPHRLQSKVDMNVPDFNAESYHCPNPRKVNLKKLDPSCCIGFYLRTRDEWSAWCETISGLVTPPQIQGIRSEYPMFVVSPGRSSDTRCLNDWVNVNGDASLSNSLLSPGSMSLGSHQELETEEFVFL